MDQRDDYTRELLSAYLDNELSPDERIAVERLLAQDADSRQWLDEIRAVASGVALLPRYRLDTALAARVIERAAIAESTDSTCSMGARSISIGSTRSAAQWWIRRSVAGWAAVAACLALSWFLWLRREDSSATGQVGPLAALPPSAQRAPGERSDFARESARAAFDRSGDRPAHETADSPPVPGSAPAADVGTEPDGTVAPAAAAPAASLRDSSGRELAATPAQDRMPGDGGSVARMRRDDVGPESVQPQWTAPTNVPDAAEGGQPEPDWTAKVPVSSSLQLLLVIDITLTQQGHELGALEQVLAQHGIALEETAQVDAALEESLLGSRFFDPPAAVLQDAPPPHVTLLYVQALGRQVDGVWRTLRSRPAHCNSVSLDLAILADDVAMFRDLRRVIQQPTGGAAAVADNRQQQRRAIAHRLALSPHWRGTPAYKLRGAKDLTGLVPDWMLGDAAPPAARLSGPPGQAPPQHLGEDLDVEALFVVH